MTCTDGRPGRTALLAKEVGVSREHLSRHFSSPGAPNLKRVIDLVRMISAAELAKNPGLDIRDVAPAGLVVTIEESSAAERLELYCLASGLTPRERRVLEAVIQTYVQTAEPAGSRVLSRGFGLGVSAATIRAARLSGQCRCAK